MNAPTLVTEQQSPRRAAADLVDVFVPGVTAPEKALRVRIFLCREKMQSKYDWATSHDARRLYADGYAIAETWWRRRGVGLDELNEVIEVLTRLFIMAGKLDRLKRPDAD